MITEAQYAAATALFTAVAERRSVARPEDAFALFRQYLRTVLEGPAEPSSGRMLDLVVTCNECGERIEVSVPVD